jgi:hypothetical protein
MISDEMIGYYLELFEQSMWDDDGKLRPVIPPRTEGEKAKSRSDCQRKLYSLIPGTIYISV